VAKIFNGKEEYIFNFIGHGKINYMLIKNLKYKFELIFINRT